MDKYKHTVRKTQDFSILNKKFLQNNRLTHEAKGLLGFVFSCSADWQISPQMLVKHSPKGISHIRRIFTELEEHGYLVRMKTPFLNDIDYYFYDDPDNRMSLSETTARINKSEKCNLPVANSLIRNKSLTFKARGMMLCALAHPVNTHFSDDFFIGISANNRASARSGIAELKAAGYMRRLRVKNVHTGLVMYWRTFVVESPDIWDALPVAETDFYFDPNPNDENLTVYKVLKPVLKNRKDIYSAAKTGSVSIVLLSLRKRLGKAIMQMLIGYCRRFKARFGRLPEDIEVLSWHKNIERLAFAGSVYHRIGRYGLLSRFFETTRNDSDIRLTRFCAFLAGCAHRHSDEYRAAFWHREISKAEHTHGFDVAEILREYLCYYSQRSDVHRTYPERSLQIVLQSIESFCRSRKERHDFDYMLDQYLIHSETRDFELMHFTAFLNGFGNHLTKKVA